MQNYLYYITKNKQLRCIPLKYTLNEGQNEVWTCVVSEPYLVTGLYLNGILIDPYVTTTLVDMGLKPIEVFFFRTSNLGFKVPPDEYRQENVQFELVRDLIIPKG